MHYFLLFLLMNGQVYLQSDWDLLATTSIKKGYDQFLGEEIELPVFPEMLRKMEGKVITLEGYIIPIGKPVNQSYFVLSRYPYQSCFFCGGAGPETVVEVFAERKVLYTDDRVRVKGILELNENDPLRLFFLIRDCSVEDL